MTGTPRLLKLAAQRFDYPTVEVGATPDGLVTVFVDTSLEPNAKIVAAGLLGLAPNLVKQCEAWFGIPCQPVNLIVAPLSGSNDGSGGAYHADCSFTNGGDLYVDYAGSAGVTMDAGLFIAELTECFMGAQGKGWNCGGSGGEALSRLCAELVSGGPGGALSAFASAPSWDQAGRPDWISADQGSDQDYPSIGCGLVYLSWMMAQGFSAAQIAQAGETVGTLESNYAALTGQTGGYVAMTTALLRSNIQITNDDPFGGIATNPQPAPQPVPQPTPQPQPAPEPQPTPSPQPSPAPSGTPITKAALLAALQSLPD